MVELKQVSEDNDDEIMKNSNLIVEIIVLVIKIPIFIVCIAFWTTVGGLIWITYLSRTIAIFFIGTLNAMLNRKTPTRGQDLHHAISFFPVGYIIFFNSVFRKRVIPGPKIIEKLGMGRMLFEIFWAAIFWMINLVFLYFFLYHSPTFESWFVKLGYILTPIFDVFEHLRQKS